MFLVLPGFSHHIKIILLDFLLPERDKLKDVSRQTSPHCCPGSELSRLWRSTFFVGSSQLRYLSGTPAHIIVYLDIPSPLVQKRSAGKLPLLLSWPWAFTNSLPATALHYCSLEKFQQLDVSWDLPPNPSCPFLSPPSQLLPDPLYMPGVFSSVPLEGNLPGTGRWACSLLKELVPLWQYVFVSLELIKASVNSIVYNGLREDFL